MKLIRIWARLQTRSCRTCRRLDFPIDDEKAQTILKQRRKDHCIPCRFYRDTKWQGEIDNWTDVPPAL